MKASKVLFLVFLILMSLCVVNTQPVKSQSFEPVYIKPDGSVVGTDKIQRNGTLYTLTGDISGGIHVERSYIVIDGAGHTVRGNGTGGGIDISNYFSYGYESHIPVNNVTVVNLRIFSFYAGISVESPRSNAFIGNYIEGCETGFSMIASNNVLTHNTIRDCVGGIAINYGEGNVITENNIINNDVSVWLSQETVVDRNYWSGSYLYIDGNSARDNNPLRSPVDISVFQFPPIPKTPLDTTPPTVSVFSPENITYAVNNVTLTLTVSEPPSWIGYSLDGQANVTIAEPTTLRELSNGKHSLTVYANDAAGNSGSETIYFSIETQHSESFPIIWIAAAIAILVVAVTAVTIYMARKRKKVAT